MHSICFVGTYSPIMCGIADYTEFITNHIPEREWGVVSFNLEGFSGNLLERNGRNRERIYYGIPDFSTYAGKHGSLSLIQLKKKIPKVFSKR